MNIELHIERLVLDGTAFSRRDAERVRMGIEAQLTQLLQGGGLSPELLQGGAVPTIQAVMEQPAAQPTPFGAQVARAVYAQVGAPANTGKDR